MSVNLHLLLLLSLLQGVCVSPAPQPHPPAPPSLALWLDTVLSGRAAQLRPVLDWRTVTLVTIDFTVLAVLDMDEKHEKLLLYILYRQVWHNEYLSWEPALYHGVRQVSVPVKELWIPDISVHEIAGENSLPRSHLVSVSHLGQVEQIQPHLLVSSCPLDLHHFPLDRHTCNLTFGSLAHTWEEVRVQLSPQFVEIGRNWDRSFSQGEWELVSLTVPGPTSSILSKSPSNTSTVRVQVTVRRRPLLYLVTLLLPSSFLLLLDGLAFLIPPYYKQRLSVKTTIFTGHFIFIFMVFSLFPPFRGQLPLIEVYLIGSLGLLACSAMETALIFQLSNDRSAWVAKYIFPPLSQLVRKGKWEDAEIKALSEELIMGDGRVERVEASVGRGVWPQSLARLKQELSRVRRELESLRKQQDRLSLSRELGTALDHAYLYLHCLTLLLGGAVLYILWAPNSED
ncbi:5-hydroxytryptamine receptor 3A-like [Lepisosteus oculatus]|uniref:5-hydroxytryptamine receptor 3A-like n=1 Tax=Lepisosteus oculatus TaxID=7918 RepID=UPI0035F52E32